MTDRTNYNNGYGHGRTSGFGGYDDPAAPQVRPTGFGAGQSGCGSGKAGGDQAYGLASSGAHPHQPLPADWDASNPAAGRAPLDAGPHADAIVARPSDAVRADVARALADADLAIADLAIEVDAGDVTLRGTLDDEDGRAVAVACAGRVAGVVRVIDRLHLGMGGIEQVPGERA